MFLFSSQTTRVQFGREKENLFSPSLPLSFEKKKKNKGKLKEEVEKRKGTQREE